MIELRQLNDIVVMEVTGELGLSNVRQFDSVLDLALRSDVGRLVLDVTRLAHIDYKLVPHLLDRMIEIECLGGKLKFAGWNPYIANILKVMGFEEEFYSSVEDAVISFTPVSPEEMQ